MRFRFRIGPFTFGRTGTRLSLWSRNAGVSIPLTGKGRTFGKIGVGPVRGYFGGSPKRSAAKEHEKAIQAGRPLSIGSDEAAAIEAFGSDLQLKTRLRNHGVPWRGVQERLKQELPGRGSDRDDVAYQLTPKAMDAVFGPQGAAWKTEKRPSKSGRGFTTWIVIIGVGE